MHATTEELFRRRSDRSLVELPWSRNRYFEGEEGPAFIRRTTLAKLAKIEALRWDMMQRVRPWDNRRHKAVDAIKALGEAYISRKDTQPTRITVEKYDYYGRDSWSVREDRDYWRHVPVKLIGKNSPLAALAEIGDQKEWEDELARRVAALSDEKLAAGNHYHRLDCHIHRLYLRIGKLNSLIELSVKALGLLRVSRLPAPKRLVNVQINGRLYPFEVESGHIKAMTDLWPYLGEEQVVLVPARFEPDDSIIGLDENAVWTRLGEPDRVVDLPDDAAGHDKVMGGAVWVYGNTGIVVSRFRTVTRIIRAEELMKVVAAKPGKKGKRQVSRA